MRILSPAKINLLLDVTGRRADGYHDLFTIMVPVSFYDTIYIEHAGKGIELEAPGCGCGTADNLIFKAASLFMHQTGIKDGVKIRVEKKIPFSAGLGGGSSNASHTLVALDFLFGTNLGETMLSEIARRIGADCPFFIHGKSALMTGRGDILLSDVSVENRVYLLIIPPFGISTARLFSKYKMSLTIKKDMFKITDITEGIIAPEKFLFNELETSAFELHPELKEVKDDLTRTGASGALMSGSGSTVFGVFEDGKHLEHAMTELKKREGYRYIPTTRTLGGVNGDYRG